MANHSLNPANDAGTECDAHGQAAMLLVESLLHGLILRDVIAVEDAIEIVDTAAEVKAELVAEAGLSPAVQDKSLAALDAIRASLRQDIPAKRS